MDMDSIENEILQEKVQDFMEELLEVCSDCALNENCDLHKGDIDQCEDIQEYLDTPDVVSWERVWILSHVIFGMDN